MSPFPAVDPIPLPAPVWLFKSLHALTLTSHFLAVELLLGGLTVALVLHLRGRAAPDARTEAAELVLRRLPVVMAYVVNLAIPPLLFAQVLYGRGLYTSSILIGFFWLGVVGLVMGSYYLLHLASGRTEQGRSWIAPALVSLSLALGAAFILSTNMTFMLKPEEWLDHYRAHPRGTHLPLHDPTLLPRWLLLVGSSPGVAGVGLLLMAARRKHVEDVRKVLRKSGSLLAAVFAPIHAGLGLWVFAAQPSAVQQQLLRSPLACAAASTWLISAGLLGAIAIALYRGGHVPRLSAAAAFFTVIGWAGLVIFRDLIRDATLRLSGLEVFDRVVSTNWSVVVLFVALLVVGVGALGWMAGVVASAEEERRHA